MVIKKEGFGFLLADDEDHEQVYCEIYYNGDFVCQINQEQKDIFDLENHFVTHQGERVVTRIKLNDFLEAIDKACDWLSKGKKPS